jgi:hypothetical protein
LPLEEAMRRRARRSHFVVGAVVAIFAVVPLLGVVKNITVHAPACADASPDKPLVTSSEGPPHDLLGAAVAETAVARSTSGPAIDRGWSQRQRQVIQYDRRSFDQMGNAWEREAEDPEWSLNVKTFVGAMIETLDERADAQSPYDLSVRCRQTVCRLDVETADFMTLGRVLESSRPQQPHVTYHLSSSDAGTQVEAYLGRDRGFPIDEQ